MINWCSSGGKKGLAPLAVALVGSIAFVRWTEPVALGVQHRAQSPTAAQLGYRKITSEQYLPPYFSKELVDNLVTVWDGEDAKEASGASPERLKKIAYRRYGFVEAPYDNGGAPINFMPGKKGTPGEKGWAFSCLGCHAGTLLGHTIVGLGNNRVDQQTLMLDVARFTRKIAASAPIPESTMREAMPIPFGSAMGTNNGLGLAAGLIAFRSPDLELQSTPQDFGNSAPPMDTPPWWNLKKKSKHFYIDGLVAAGPRAMEHALLFPENSGQFVRDREKDFEDIRQWMDTLEPPKYPLPVNEPLARSGEQAFGRACASCHGTYGPGGSYPEKQIPIDVVGTDRMRLDGMTRKFREYYNTTWFAHYGEKKGLEPRGYIAPPLDGIWASAPYFHNGSVPTLRGVLNSRQRPALWKAVRDGDPNQTYDLKNVGLALEPGVTTIPPQATDADRRRFYDARVDSSGRAYVPGQTKVGHTFPDSRLSPDEKEAVLEYLKTL
ncbi:MAG: hypothetical protein ABI895_23105 [Deltaproteobacteria bacterium]